MAKDNIVSAEDLSMKNTEVLGRRNEVGRCVAKSVD